MTSPKINMGPENHPFQNKNNLPDSKPFVCSILVFRGVYCLATGSFKKRNQKRIRSCFLDLELLYPSELWQFLSSELYTSEDLYRMCIYLYKYCFTYTAWWIYLYTHTQAGWQAAGGNHWAPADRQLPLSDVCMYIYIRQRSEWTNKSITFNQSFYIEVFLCNIALLISLVLFPAIGAPQVLKMIYLQYDMRIQGGTFRFWYHPLMLSAIVSKTNTASHTRSHKFHPSLPKPKGSRAWPPSARVVA